MCSCVIVTFFISGSSIKHLISSNLNKQEQISSVVLNRCKLDANTLRNKGLNIAVGQFCDSLYFARSLDHLQLQHELNL